MNAVAPAWAPPNVVPEDSAKQDGVALQHRARSISVRRLSEPSARLDRSWPNVHLRRHQRIRPIGAPAKRKRLCANTKSFRVPEDARNPGWRSRCRREVWISAAQTLAILLRNASACVAFAWLATCVFSFGNVLSGHSAQNQSDFEFLTGTSIATHLFFYCMFLGAHATSLLPLEFTRHQEKNQQIKFLFCVQRLARRTLGMYLLSLLLLAGFLAVLRISPRCFQERHSEFYVSVACIHLYVASLGVALRRIFREETVIGQSGQRFSSFQRRNSAWSSTRYFWKTWARTFPILGAIVLAGLYVQFASRYRVTGTWDFVGYTLGSLVLKAVIKEAAKLWTRHRKIRDPRTIFLVVGLPTVLIDTQVRIVLQRAQNSQYALAWVFGMAGLEIAMRVSKVVWVKQRLQGWDSRLASDVVAGIAVGARTGNRTGQVDAVAKRFGSLRDDSRAIQSKVQLVAFQIAESYANMSAEYIAIGCSSSILFFYWDHPKYHLRSYGSDTSAVDSTTRSSSWYQGSSLLLQLVVEVLVDYISSVVEIGEGIDFPEIRRYHVYLGSLFSCIACANVHICSMVYMSVR